MHTQDDPPDDGDKLKNVIKTNQIRLNISIRMRDGISHTSLSGKIHHNGRSVLLEYIIYCVFICQISFDESEPFIMRELVKAIFLKTHIVIIIYIIETDNMNPFNRIKQLLCKIRADESRSASDQYSGIMQINCVLHFSSSTSLCWVGICKQRMYSSPRERI